MTTLLNLDPSQVPDDGNSLVYNAASKKWLPTATGVTLDLPSPAYIAHRGGSLIAPENTLEAFRVAAASGADAIEMDLQTLGDGSLGLMHDATVDRTTDGTGPVTSFTAPAWAALDAAAALPWNGKTAAPALLPQVLGEFGGQVPLFIEPKDVFSTDALIDQLEARNLARSVVVECSSLFRLESIKARGDYKAFYWFIDEPTATTAAIAAAVGGGADYLGARQDFTDAKVLELVATGLPVFVYTVNRRTDRDRLLGLGVAGFLSDNPYYLRTDTALRTTDSWRQGVLGHGFTYNASSIDMSTIEVIDGAVTFNHQTVYTAYPGELLPITADTYTIDVEMGFDTLPSPVAGSVTVIFAQPNDANKGMANAAAYPDGYMLLQRATGAMSLYRLTDGTVTVTTLGTVTAPAMVAGERVPLRVTVTPTTITITRDPDGLDGGPYTVGPISDATHRGGYFSIGKKDTVSGIVSAKNLTVS